MWEDAEIRNRKEADVADAEFRNREEDDGG